MLVTCFACDARIDGPVLAAIADPFLAASNVSQTPRGTASSNGGRLEDRGRYLPERPARPPALHTMPM